MRVVGNETRVPRVDLVVCNGFCHLFQVVPRRAFPKHGVHAEPHFCERVFFARRFVTTPYARSDIGVQPVPRFGNGIMPRGDLARFQRFAHDIVRVLVA